MAAVNQDFTVYQGDPIALEFDVLDDAGAAVNLTALSISWALSRSLSEAPSVTKTKALGQITVAAGTGAASKARVPLLLADTSSLAEGLYVHELVVDGITVATGRVRLHASALK